MEEKKTDNLLPKDKRSHGRFSTVVLPILVILVTCAVLVLSIVFVFRGLADDEKPVSIKPESEIDGYYSSDQTVSGGEYLNDIAINNVDIERVGEDIVISMAFNYKSSDTTSTETKLTGVVPPYHVYMMTEPYRVAVNIEDLGEWQFTGKTSWLEQELIKSAFVMQPTRSSADNPTVIYQLETDAAFRVEEDNGMLKIYIRTIETKSEPKYFVVVNGVAEYVTYAALRETALTPTLASDLTHTMLISNGFQTEEKAQKYLDSIADLVEEYMPGKTPEIQLLTNPELPEFGENLEMEEIDNMPVIFRDGKPEKAEALEINANVLSRSPDGNSILCYSPVYTNNSVGETSYSEILYTSNESDTYTKLVDAEFTAVLYAAWSSDSRRVAILDYDSDQGTTALYVYDTETNELTLASEAELGSFVYDAAWDDQSPVLYAITADDDGNAHLMAYSAEAADGDRIFSLAELDSYYGSVASSNGSVYYSDADVTEGQDPSTASVWKLDLLTGETVRVADGAKFRISPDGKYLASSGSEGLNENMPVTVTELSSGKSYTLDETSLVDLSFSDDSSRLLVLTDGDDNSSKYPGSVYVFDTASHSFTMLFNTDVTDIEWSIEANCVLLNDVYYTQENYIPVVYKVRL